MERVEEMYRGRHYMYVVHPSSEAEYCVMRCSKFQREGGVAWHKGVKECAVNIQADMPYRKQV